MNSTDQAGSTRQHVFSMAPLGVWLRLIAENGGVSSKYWGKLARVLAISAMFAPIRIAERLWFSRSRMARVQVDKEPLYIQGFARSGTTHLLNLFAQDPSFGVVSTFQSIAAPVFLTGRGWLERLIEGRIPETRPMDNMVVSLDLPNEEDVALANSSHHSPAHLLSFPRRAREFLEKYSTMQLSDFEMVQWQTSYLDVLRRATFAADGKKLLLKSPANLGRTATLLRMFPDAKFVHIVRNPYVVYQSMTHLYDTMLPICQLDDADADDVALAIRDSYVSMMKQYMLDRELIREGHLAELRYEDLERDPLTELARLYSELGLSGWTQARERVDAYLSNVADYRKNDYEIDPQTIDVVNREWGFAVREWKYAPPSVVSN